MQYVNAISVAARYAMLGDTEAAFEWLEIAYRERDPMLVLAFNMNPFFDPVRSDPRFAELAKRVGVRLVAPDGPLTARLPN